LCNDDRCKANEGRDEGSHNECEPKSRQKLVLTKESPQEEREEVFENRKREEDKE